MPDTMIQTIAAPSLGPAAVPPSVPPGVPVEIAKAISEIMAQVKSLPKGEWNEHGRYGFASVDDFLAEIGPLCAAAGLIVFQDEESMDVVDRGNKAWLKATYAFTLGHANGVTSSQPIRRTVFQSITGPQTSGSCQSYAHKMFLRSLFMIPTGDREDPDFQRQQDMPAAQEARQKPAQRATTPPRAPAPQKPAAAVQQASGGPGGIEHIHIPEGASGLKIGSWITLAKTALDGQPEDFRREWLEEHLTEVDEVRRLRPEWADKLVAQAIAPDAAVEN
jgi:hypothetical protein